MTSADRLLPPQFAQAADLAPADRVLTVLTALGASYLEPAGIEVELAPGQVDGSETRSPRR
jgi:hypothetical protein